MVSYFVWFFILVFFIFCEKSLEIEKRKNLKCECGKLDDFVPRIVGGRNSEPDQHPWMVAIFNQGKSYCGGTLINDRYILTAGHCIKFTDIRHLSVVLGVHMLTDSLIKGNNTPEIEDAFVHENFSSNHLYDYEDIGLIKLKHAVQFTPDVKPICLPENDQDYAGKNAAVVGWGKLSEENEEPSLVLMQAFVTVLENENCRKNPALGDQIIDTFLCAYENNVDACQGDSGGPLIYRTKTDKMEQIGIVSWGLGCARPNIPGVYTRITSYMDWIWSRTKDANYCETPK